MPHPEPLSPELVLVAPPEEARRAREQLPEPAAAEHAVADRPAEWDELLARLRAEPLTSEPEAERTPVRPPRKRRGWRRSAVGVATLVLAVLVGMAWARHDSPQPRLIGPTSESKSVTHHVVKSPPAPAKPKPRATKPHATKPRAKKRIATHARPAPAKRRPKPAAPRQRHVGKKPVRVSAPFVPSRVWSWAPVPGSSGYRVRFFRNGRTVLDVRTAKARLVLPKSFAFHKGRYRWRVVPIGAGKPRKPIVDSTFIVSRG